MASYTHKGGCHCGNVTLEFRSDQPPAEFQPRVCDCSFCRRHGAAYVSDPRGRLVVAIRKADDVSRYRQGSESAELLICKRCGVLSAVLYPEEGHMYATVNINALEDQGQFGARVPVSPWRLGIEEKRARWKKLWFTDVSVTWNS